MTANGRPSLEELLNRQYSFVVQADAAGGYVVMFPDLPGCATQVETVEEIPAAAREIRELWIESEHAAGRDVPRPTHRDEYSGRFNVRIARSLHRRLVESAEREGVSLNQYVMTLLDRVDALARVDRRLDEIESTLHAANGDGIVAEPSVVLAAGPAEAARPPWIPEGYSTATPYICVHDAATALDFYRDAFGAVELTRLQGMPDDPSLIGHAEMVIGDSHIMLSDEWAAGGVFSPKTLGGAGVSFSIYVPDADEAFARAVAAGATPTRPVEDQFYGSRAGWVTDPFGFRWSIGTHTREVGDEELHRLNDEYMDELRGRDNAAPGDSISRLVLSVADVERAKAFFGGLFGWEFGPADGEDGHVLHEVTNAGIALGLSNDAGGCPVHAGEPPHRVYIGVADAEAAVARVQRAGGRVEHAGTDAITQCRDDQGTPIGIWPAPVQPSPATASGVPEYVTFEVADAGRARRFYEAVFGWAPEPGDSPGGYHIPNTTFPCGIYATDAAIGLRVSYRVANLDAVLARVTELGGTSDEPVENPVGWSADCVDDQGTPFSLLQLRTGM